MQNTVTFFTSSGAIPEDFLKQTFKFYFICLHSSAVYTIVGVVIILVIVIMSVGGGVINLKNFFNNLNPFVMRRSRFSRRRYRTRRKRLVLPYRGRRVY